MTCTAVYLAVAVAHWWLWPQAIIHVASEVPAIVRTLSTHAFTPDCDRRYWLQINVGDHDLGVRAETTDQEERRLFYRELARSLRAVEARVRRSCADRGWPVEVCGP